MRLDRLLDNDVLLPDQERALRRLVKYKIHQVKDGYLLKWMFRLGDSNIYQIPAKTLEELYSVAYKEIMVSVIETDMNGVSDSTLIEEVKSIIENGIINKYADRILEINFYSDESIWIPAAKDIKASALFEAFRIVCRFS